MNNQEISFDDKFASFTPEEDNAVNIITQRIFDNLGRKRLQTRMDLSATHKQCPLKLAELAAASNWDLGHDLAGIAINLNHATGELENHFVPRYAK
ncbi:MAG: hypothetical protein V3W52_17250 [Syntrophobacteria bacterium]